MGLIFQVTYHATIGRLFNVRPRIRLVNGAIVATTAPHIAVLSLGLKLRKVMVDPNHRAIRIFARYAWFFTKVKRIPFEDVKYVLYKYVDASPLGGLPNTTYQEQDLFVVGVRLRNRKEHTLVRFYGQGDFANNSIMPDWVYFDQIGMSRLSQGSQEDESRLYATSVANMIGVELTNE